MSANPVLQTEHAWINRAIELAVANVHDGGGPFGAVVVRDGEIVATGANRVTADLDPTAHAEVSAIRAACQNLGTFSLVGCVLVTSCEPCPMCLSAALWARVDRVLFAADRDDAAAAGFDDSVFHEALRKPETCPVPVIRIETPDRNAAFQAWQANTNRTPY